MTLSRACAVAPSQYRKRYHRPVPTDHTELLREARRRAGISQRELARRAGTSQAVISAYENGHREPGINQLQRVVAAAGFGLGLTLEQPADTRADPWQLSDDSEDDDRILENLRLTPVERLRKMGQLRAFTSSYRGALRPRR